MKVHSVLTRYGIKPIHVESIQKGSTNTNYAIDSAAGSFLLRRYALPQESAWNRIVCTRETVQYEHDVLRYAAENGIPCIVPVENRAGTTITELDGRLYALFPYVATQPYRPACAERGAREARLLARYHTVMERYPVTEQRPGWGYASQLGVWFHQNQVGIGTLDEILAWIESLEPIDDTHAYVRRNASCIRDLVELAHDRTFQTAYAEYPLVVNHGDYIAKNLGTRESQLVLFDFDACVRDLRIYDLALLVGFTAGEAHTARNMDAQIARNIVRAYREIAPMTDGELSLVPAMLVAFRLRLLMGNLGILRSTGSYAPDLLRRNLEGMRWLMDHRRAIVSMLTG